MKSGAGSRKSKITDENRAESARLKELWERAGRPDQTELGAEMDMGQSAVSSMLNGYMAITLRAARVFAKELHCEIQDFSMRLAKEAEATAEVVRAASDDFADIKITAVRVSGGQGYADVPEYEEELGTLKFRRTFLRSVGVTEAHAKIVTVRGHSMDPTITDGASLLINTANRVPQKDKFYVFWRPHEGLVVKRVVKESGRWVARSDNDDRITYPDFPFVDDQYLLGRAVWMGVRL